MARIPRTKYSDVFTTVRHWDEAEMLVSPNTHGDVQSNHVGTDFPAGVGGDNCARPFAAVC